MRDITNDRYFQFRELTEFFINGHQVQQTLGRMLSTAVTAIDDTALDRFTLDQFIIVVFITMANDRYINDDCRHGQDSIIKCFAFLD